MFLSKFRPLLMKFIPNGQVLNFKKILPRPFYFTDLIKSSYYNFIIRCEDNNFLVKPKKKYNFYEGTQKLFILLVKNCYIAMEKEV